jgi:hypothetical protein
VLFVATVTHRVTVVFANVPVEKVAHNRRVCSVVEVHAPPQVVTPRAVGHDDIDRVVYVVPVRLAVCDAVGHRG